MFLKHINMNTKKTMLTSLFFLLMMLFPSMAMEVGIPLEHQQLVGKIKKLDGPHEIYVGAGFTQAGEPIYFAMEKITDKNYQTWIDYKDFAYELTDQRGPLRGLSVFSNLNHDQFKEKYKEHYSDYLYELAKTIEPKKKKISMLIFYIPSGILGFNDILKRSNASKDVYVVYISKNPITGIFTPKIPLSKEAFREMSISDKIRSFDEAYDDIIMSVGIENPFFHEDKKLDPGIRESVEHRGIFRNPLSAVRDDYKGISLLIHGFAGAVEFSYFQDKHYMMVLPTEGMANILQKNIKPGDLFIDETGMYGEEVSKTFPPLPGRGRGYGTEGVQHFVRLEALKTFYSQ